MIRVFSCLQRHPSSGILYFRRSVPARLRPVFGRTEIKRSLNTCDKKVALPLAMRLNVEVDKLFLNLEKNGPMAKQKLGLITINGLTLPSGAKAESVVVDTGDDEKDVEAAGKLLGIDSATSPPEKSTNLDDSAKLDEVAKKYRDEKVQEGSWRSKTAAEHEALHELLIQVLGNIDVSTIGHKEARQFKETLLKLPANMGKGTYAGKTARQILREDIPESARMSTKTINEKIQRVSSLFGWAVRQGYAQLNPFGGLKMRNQRKASEERAVFDSGDLKKIFDPERFSLEKLRKPFKYWCPLLALYTGARAKEIAQLRVEDVFEQDGIWGIFITPDAGDLKTIGSKRKVPLHPTILDRGFLEYVEQTRVGGHEKLFPEAWDTENGPGDKLSRYFAVYRKKLNIGQLKKGDGMPVKCFHSFRHSFVDGLKQAGADPLKIKQLTGHKDSDITTGRYGKDYPLNELYDVVCLLNFDIP
nr:site-specific integrase [uncultured Desulfobulbus sp.]